MKYIIYIFFLVLILTACGSNNVIDKKYLGIYMEGSFVYAKGGSDPSYGCYKADFQKDSVTLCRLTIYFTSPMKIDTSYISTTAYKSRFNMIETGNKLIPKLKIKGNKLVAPEVYYDEDQSLLIKELVFENILNYSDMFLE